MQCAGPAAFFIAKRGLVTGPCGLRIRTLRRTDTVLAWLVEAAEQRTAFSAYFLCELKAGEITETKAIKRLSRSPHWVWGAIDPVTTLRVALDVGERTQAMAQRFIHHVATDHVWSLKEVLLFRVPPWPQTQTVEAAASMDDCELKRLRSAHIPAKWVEWGVENPLGVRMTG